MNYYEQLYDVDFLSGSDYVTDVGGSSIRICKPGEPEWSSWKGVQMSSERAQSLFNNARADGCVLELERHGRSDSDLLVLALALCEDAYRRGDENCFFLLNRLVLTSNMENVQLKAIKLHYAWSALRRLVPAVPNAVGSIRTELAAGAGSFGLMPGPTGKETHWSTAPELSPIGQIVAHALEYLRMNDRDSYSVTETDIQVETPVRRDWLRNKVSYDRAATVDQFYRRTFSYILELTAANHQVETLFNYIVVLELLSKLGVDKVFDYGAGIGTFLGLANTYGMAGVYADVESNTMKFGLDRMKALGYNVEVVKLDPHRPDVPTGLDCIVCTEVLEHIYEPEYLIKEFYSALRPGGILVVSESFNYVEGFCAHLPMHRGKGGERFARFLEEVGFWHMATGFLLHPTVHVRR